MNQKKHSGRDSKHFQTMSHIVRHCQTQSMVVKHFPLQNFVTNNESTSTSDLSKHLPRCIAVLLSSEEAPTPPLHSNPIFLLAVWSAYTLRLVRVAEQTSWTLTLLVTSSYQLCILDTNRWMGYFRKMPANHGWKQNLRLPWNKPISARWPWPPSHQPHKFILQW